MPLSSTTPDRPSWLLRLPGLLLAAALLLLPAAWNGLPLMYPDTPTYLRGAETGLMRLLGPAKVAPWVTPAPSGEGASREAGTRPGPASPVPGTDRALPERAAGLSDPEAGVVLAGRSVYYGALLEAAQLAGSLWWAAAAQALCLAWLLRLLLVGGWGLSAPAFLATTGILALASPAGLFAGLLMPDLFAGIAILATALLLAPGWALRAGQEAALVLLLLFALSAHASHLATVAVMLAGAIAWHLGGVWRTRRRARIASIRWAMAGSGPVNRSAAGSLDPGDGITSGSFGRNGPSAAGLALVTACVAGALLAEAAFSQAVTRAVGAPPLRLPHLTARLVNQGPGTDYLRQACPRLAPADRWAACDFLGRYPLAWTDFLFEPDPARGVFAPADAATKRRLSQEQTALAWQVLRHDPAGVLGGMAADAIRQLGMFRIDVWGLGPRELALYEGRVPLALMAAMQASRGAREPQWQDRFSSITQAGVVTSLVGLLALGALALRGERWGQGSPESRDRNSAVPLAAWVLAGLVLNAAVCAAAAAPLDRFQARVVWRLPLLAAGLALRPAPRRKATPDTSTPADPARAGSPSTRWATPARPATPEGGAS